MKKILIITPDIEGPVRNGGIGTAFTALSTALAEKGHHVDILYTSGQYIESGSKSFQYWSDCYSNKNINLFNIDLCKSIEIDAPYFRKKSYSIYLWLKDNDIYDVVISCEWQANLYYTLLSKSNGSNFEKTKFVINTHSSTLWSDEGNYQLPYDQNHLELYYMERMVVEMADEVISPSEYLFNWMKAKDWQIPDNNKVILNCEPFKGLQDEKQVVVVSSKQPVEKYEIVFFGRLETRKGLDIFLKALENMTEDDLNSISCITFLGKSISSSSFNSVDHIGNRTKNLDITTKIITDYDRTQANDYLKRKNILAVMPSLVENSPYTVYECLINNINFISSNVGGIPELISKEFHSEILFTPNPIDLYNKIHKRIKNFNCTPGLIQKQEEIISSWLEVIDTPTPKNFIKVDKENGPKVSICITHFDRHQLLQHAIFSVQQQTYKNLEVILVDDGSKEKESHEYLNFIEKDFEERKWKIIRSSNNYLGAARNLAASHASGDYLLFMDDDNVAKPNEVETLLRCALNSNSDIVTTPSDLIFNNELPSPLRKTTHCWLPLGPDANIASFTNCFGDANALIKREVFMSLGGFTEDYGIGHEDWEFFLKACLNGFKIQLEPEPMFWYRVANTGMLLSGNKSKNNYRSFRPFMQENTKHNYSLGIIHGLFEKINRLENENHHLKNYNGTYSLNEKIEHLVSQQREGWAHDRFNVLNDKLSYLISQQENGWANDRFNSLHSLLTKKDKKSSAIIRLLRKIINK